MKTMVSPLFALGLLAGAACPVLADTGGVPNDNAFFQTGNGDPNGRKGVCIPPGSAFKGTAKLPGPNNDPIGTGQSPGQVVQAQCDPGNPS
jgi:hypothetical protein